MKKLAFVVSLFLTLAVSGLSAQASLMLADSDNKQAIKQLTEWLNNRGTPVTISDSGNYLLYEDYEDDLIIALYPKMSKLGLDRILAYVYFNGLDQSEGQGKLYELANRLNTGWNIGTFFIDDDGALGVESQITFVDYIDYVEIKNFLRWFGAAVVEATSEEWLDNYLE